MLTQSSLEDALEAVGDLLEEGKHLIEVVAIGGGGLLLLGLITRATKDLDLVGLKRGDELVKPVPLPAPLSEAADDVAKLLKLSPGWLNAGPAAMLDLGLPPGFLDRTTAVNTAAWSSTWPVASIRSASSSTPLQMTHHAASTSQT